MAGWAHGLRRPWRRSASSFNESTLWVGEPRDYSHLGASDHLATIPPTAFRRQQKEAEQLAMKEFMSSPLRQMPYQPFADLRLQFPGLTNASDYRRELNLDDGVVRTSYRAGVVRYEHETLPARRNSCW